MIRRFARTTPFITACAIFVTILSAAQPESLETRARTVVARMAAGDFAKVEAEFNDRMKAALPPGGLEAAWANLVSQAGPLRAAVGTRITTSGDFQIVDVLCDFERAKVEARVVFDKDGKLTGLSFKPLAAPAAPYTAPAYVTPSAYQESDLTVGSGEWAVPGTLSMPAGAGPFPAVVLVAGSGPNDRDETLGPNKPLKDLAGGLASRGIAVLRYDKRTKVHPAKLAAIPDFTVKQEVVDDVLEAVKSLRANPKVDRARVFVLGHSLGGMLIPRIAAADPSLAGLIVMAGPARSLDEAMLEQTRYMAMADGTISPAEQAGIDRAAGLVATVKALKPEDAKSTANISGAPAAYWLDLRGYDPLSAAKAVKAPMLVLQGERDYQVTMPEFEQWKAALAGRPNVTFHSYPALNHLFLAGTGKSLPAEYQTPGHVAEEVVRDIADFIKR